MSTDFEATLSYGETPTTLLLELVVPFKQLESTTEYISTPLYIRRHIMEQSAKLDAFNEGSQLKTQLLTGPPGSGKTSFLALWARMYARNNNKRVLVVNLRDEKPLQILKLNQSKAEYYERRNLRTILRMRRGLLTLQFLMV